MTPPHMLWARCCHCLRPFNAELVRATDQGWRHVRRCDRHGNNATRTERDQAAHHQAWLKKEAFMEDLLFLADNGAGMHEAAQRLGINPETLDRTLMRDGHHQLASRLRLQDWRSVA